MSPEEWLRTQQATQPPTPGVTPMSPEQWLASQAGQSPTQPTAEPSMASEIGRQVGLTARGAAEGVAGLAGMVTDPLTSLINTTLSQPNKIPMAREAVSSILNRLGVAQPRNETERVVNQAVQSMAGAGGTIGLARGIAGALGPTGQAVAGQLAAQPLQQTAGALGSGVGVGAAQESSSGPMQQLAAGLAGGVAGAGLAGMAPRIAGLTARTGGAPTAPTNVQGIEMLTSDVIPPSTFASKLAQSTGERIPYVGTGPLREAQQEQRVSAVRNIIRDYGAEDFAKASDSVMADLAAKRSADLSKYAQTKNQVIDSLSTDTPVPVQRTVTEIDNQIAKLQSLKSEAVTPVVNQLEDFKQAIQGQGLRNVEELRKQLGGAFKSPDLVSVRSQGEKAVGSIYGALRSDMGDYIKSNGQRQDYNKWAVSNARLSQMAGELEMGALKRTLSNGDATPEVVQGMLFSKKPSEIRQLYQSLTPQGRSAAQVAILAKAGQKATNDQLISPDKFANEVKRLGNSVGVFFSGSDLDRVNSLVRAVDATKRAGQAAAMPTTGVQAVPFVAGSLLADIFGSAGAATLSAGSIGAMARAYESKPVRDMLLALKKTSPGSQEEAALAKRLVSSLSQVEQQTD